MYSIALLHTYIYSHLNVHIRIYTNKSRRSRMWINTLKYDCTREYGWESFSRKMLRISVFPTSSI